MAAAAASAGAVAAPGSRKILLAEMLREACRENVQLAKQVAEQAKGCGTMHARALAAEASVSELQAALTAALAELQRLTVTHSTTIRKWDAARPVSPPLHQQSLHHQPQQQQARRVSVVSSGRGLPGESHESEDEQEVLTLLQRVGSVADVSSSSSGVGQGRSDQEPQRRGAASADRAPARKGVPASLGAGVCAAGPVSKGGGGQSSCQTRRSSGREADQEAATAVGAGQEERGAPGQLEAAAVEASCQELLQRHRRRWRAKQELLQRRATEWQYSAWRYATAWQEVTAKLQDTDLQLQVSFGCMNPGMNLALERSLQRKKIYILTCLPEVRVNPERPALCLSLPCCSVAAHRPVAAGRF